MVFQELRKGVRQEERSKGLNKFKEGSFLEI